MNIKETAKQVHRIAQDHGFWEDAELIIAEADIDTRGTGLNGKTVRSMVFAQKIALIHSELSEALEADREGKRASIEGYEKGTYITYDDVEKDQEIQTVMFKEYIKDTVEDEIADAVIRIMDLCEWMGIDLEWHIEKKMQYNSSRPYKHGKSY